MNHLTDRLMEFAREQNHDLIDRFEELRAEVLAGAPKADLRERWDAWRALLDRHVRWEEEQVISAYERRCRQEDVYGLETLVREHRQLARMADELADMLDEPQEQVAEHEREVLDEMDATLMEHRVAEENEVCAALDHALDAPTIRHIEEAYDDGTPGNSVTRRNR
jgi:hypothetical protein